jgi:uncharacterized protein RhaS with RHS repeats
MTRTNSGMGDANPDARTQIANSVSSTTYAYDNNGNLNSAGSSTFSWDYNNRMTQAVTQGSTSTYSYDYVGRRMPKAPKAVELVHRQAEKARFRQNWAEMATNFETI